MAGVSLLCQRALVRFNGDRPKYEGAQRNPLGLPEVQRQGITTWIALKQEIDSLPEPIQRYCRDMYVWIRDNPKLREPWMFDFYNNMTPNEDRHISMPRTDPWWMRPGAVEGYFEPLIERSGNDEKRRLSGMMATYKMLRHQELNARKG